LSLLLKRRNKRRGEKNTRKP